MTLHPKLTGFSTAKHIKSFDKYLKGIEGDFNSVGVIEFEVDIVSLDSPASFMHRLKTLLLTSEFGDPEEAMIIRTEVHRCPVEIAVHMGKGGMAMPYHIFVELPVPMSGRAEYRSGALGAKWHHEPKDPRRTAALQRSLPKVRMKQEQAHKGLMYTVKIGYSLEPTTDGKTMWTVLSGFEGGILTGGYRPRVQKYLEAIPSLEALLRKWNSD